jgi:drug/metabolite transporter (DMT)-like permease
MDNLAMSTTALLLVLCAAILHATWNVAAKKAGGDDRFAFVSSVMVAVLWLPTVVAFGLLDALTWGWWTWAVVVASAAVHAVYYTVLLTGYRQSDLTVVYPVARGTGPLLASLMAVLVLGEALTPLGAVGVLSVCGGIFLVAGGLTLWRRAGEATQRERALAGVRWGLATGVLISLYTVIDGYAVKVLALGPVVFDYLGNVLRAAWLAPGALRDRAALRTAMRTQWRYAFVVAAISPLAYMLVLYAMQQAPLSHVASARELSMLFAALMGGRLLGEGDRGARLLGAAFMAAGVAAFTLS